MQVARILPEAGAACEEGGEDAWIRSGANRAGMGYDVDSGSRGRQGPTALVEGIG